MPVLSNPRHERFAQEYATGQSADAAYEAAGYKPDRGNAARLTAKDSISQRVAELQAQMAAQTVKAVSVNRTSVLAELAKMGFTAMPDENIKASDKRAALLNLAQMEGWIVERHEHTGANGGPIQTVDLSNLTDEQLDQLEAIFGPLAAARQDDGANTSGPPPARGDTQH